MLFRSMRLANEYFNQAKEELRKEKRKGAKDKAWKAIYEYTPLFSNAIEKFSQTDLLNFGESLVIVERYGKIGRASCRERV